MGGPNGADFAGEAGGIVARADGNPSHVGLAAEPRHLPFGILRGAQGGAADGLFFGDQAGEDIGGLGVADGVARGGRQLREARAQFANFFNKAMGKHLAGAAGDARAEFFGG